MATPRKTPPRSLAVTLSITEEQYQRAVKSASGGCLIADAMKEQYPQLTGITVDMATIRATDREKGLRYTYLTPASAQHLLLSFDQGWRQPVETIRLTHAVKVTHVVRKPYDVKRTAEKRARRVAELEAKLNRGEELTAQERSGLARMTNPKPVRERPPSHGPVEVVEQGGSNAPVTVVGGVALPMGAPHPNLLRGRDRHFGAKLADPGQAFNEAVEQALAQRLAQADEPTGSS